MEKKNDNFRLGFNSFLCLYETAVLNPNVYSALLKNLNLNQSLIFFILNSALWLILSAAIRTFLIGKYNLFFPILSEILLLIPVIFFLILLLSFLLHILSKVAGSRSKIKNNLKAVLLSTILLPFFAIPVFKVLAAIISMYILVFCFKSANRFDKLKAFVPVVVLIGILIFALYVMGIININLIIR